MTPPPPPTDDDSRERPMGGRRMEDQLVGWRLGQLEVGLTKVEEQLILLRDDMVKRTTSQEDREQRSDWTIRIGVLAIAVLQLLNAYFNARGH